MPVSDYFRPADVLANVLPGILLLLSLLVLLSKDPLATILVLQSAPIAIVGIAILAFLVGEIISIVGQSFITFPLDESRSPFYREENQEDEDSSEDEASNIFSYFSYYSSYLNRLKKRLLHEKEEELPTTILKRFDNQFEKRHKMRPGKANSGHAKRLSILSTEDDFKPSTERLYLLWLFYRNTSYELIMVVFLYFIVFSVRLFNEVFLNLFMDPIPSPNYLNRFGKRSLVVLFAFLLLFILLFLVFLRWGERYRERYERSVVFETLVQNNETDQQG